MSVDVKATSVYPPTCNMQTNDEIRWYSIQESLRLDSSEVQPIGIEILHVKKNSRISFDTKGR